VFGEIFPIDFEKYWKFSGCNIPCCDPLGERRANLVLATQPTRTQHEYLLFMAAIIGSGFGV
jgi:hypothetical protein